MGACYIAQVGLELLASSSLPALASQTAGFRGLSHCTQLKHSFSKCSFFGINLQTFIC